MPLYNVFVEQDPSNFTFRVTGVQPIATGEGLMSDWTLFVRAADELGAFARVSNATYDEMEQAIKRLRILE